jgi:PII-like signaling protein
VQQSTPARLLRIHISELDRLKDKPLYEVIVDRCRELKIAGATVLRGVEGYGGSTEIHKGHVVRNDRPILISIVDTAENIERLIPEIEQMIDTGMMAASDVQVIRVQKKAAIQEPAH